MGSCLHINFEIQDMTPFDLREGGGWRLVRSKDLKGGNWRTFIHYTFLNLVRGTHELAEQGGS